SADCLLLRVLIRGNLCTIGQRTSYYTHCSIFKVVQGTHGPVSNVVLATFVFWAGTGSNQPPRLDTAVAADPRDIALEVYGSDLAAHEVEFTGFQLGANL